MNAAQHLLQNHFPNLEGLQDVTLGVVCNFTVNQGEFVQIIHSVPGHWLTVSTVGLKHPNIAILDSAYSNISSSK